MNGTIEKSARQPAQLRSAESITPAQLGPLWREYAAAGRIKAEVMKDGQTAVLRVAVDEGSGECYLRLESNGSVETFRTPILPIPGLEPICRVKNLGRQFRPPQGAGRGALGAADANGLASRPRLGEFGDLAGRMGAFPNIFPPRSEGSFLLIPLGEDGGYGQRPQTEVFAPDLVRRVCSWASTAGEEVICFSNGAAAGSSQRATAHYQCVLSDPGRKLPIGQLDRSPCPGLPGADVVRDARVPNLVALRMPNTPDGIQAATEALGRAQSGQYACNLIIHTTGIYVFVRPPAEKTSAAGLEMAGLWVASTAEQWSHAQETLDAIAQVHLVNPASYMPSQR